MKSFPITLVVSSVSNGLSEEKWNLKTLVRNAKLFG